MGTDLNELRARLAAGETSIESRLLHLPDPESDGPVVPDVPASSMYQAADEETLARRFQSIIDSDPPVDREIPEGAAKIYLRLGSDVGRGWTNRIRTPSSSIEFRTRYLIIALT
jgi:hypothetical protein